MGELDNIPRVTFQPGEDMDDDETLRTVRSMRIGIMNMQLQMGVLYDKDNFDMFHKNLQELDKSAQKSKQQKQEEKSSEAIIAMGKAASEELARKMGISLFTQGTPVTVDHAESLTVIDGIATPAPGELYIGEDSRTYEEFSASVGAELERKRRGDDETANSSDDSNDSP